MSCDVICAGRHCGVDGVGMGKRGMLGGQTEQSACIVTFGATCHGGRSRKPRAKESKERLPWGLGR